MTLPGQKQFRIYALLLTAGVIGSACSGVSPEPALALTDQAEQSDYGELINIAGRQRMLTQRIVKSYVQGFLDVEVPAAEQQLTDSVDRFEEQLSLLEHQQVSIGAQHALGAVRSRWTDFRDVASTPPNRDEARRLYEHGEELLLASEAVVTEIVEVSPDALAEVVNVSGRQRMLSQRYAMLYMLSAAGLATPQMQDEFEHVRSQFEDALQWLRESPENTSTSRKVLEEMAELWLWLDGALKIRSDKFYPGIVADASEKTLTAAELLTDLYARSTGRLPR